MRKQIILVCIAIYAICSKEASYGQSGLREGFIITLLNDTIPGKIEFISNSRNYKYCRFKENKEITTFYPSQISGYGYVDGKLFSSQILKDVFVEILVRGEINLFKANGIFYIQKEDEEVIKLESEAVLIGNKGKTAKSYNDKWKGIISYMIADCHTDQDAVQKVKLSMDERSLTKIAVDYNICKRSDFTSYNENKKWIKFNFSFASGITSSVISIPRSNPYLVHETRYLAKTYKSYDMSNGFLLSITLPEQFENMALQVETHYIKSDFYSHIETGTVFIKEFHDTDIMIKTLMIPVSLKYNIPEKIFPVFIQAGYSFFCNFQSEAVVKTDYERLGVVTSRQYPAMKIAKVHTDIWGRIGFYKRFTHFEGGIGLSYLRINSPLGWNSLPPYNAYIDRLMLSVLLSSW